MLFQKILKCSCQALGLVLVALCLTSCATQSQTVTVEQKPKPPNIVIILADDLGWNDVGYHGSELETPTIDSLAQAGVRLERFYALPVCTPSRYALLTGKYPMRGGFQLGTIKPWADWGLPPEEQTLPEILGAAGYSTAIIGKWHLGHWSPESLPLNHGFDFQYGPYNGVINYYTHERLKSLDWHRNQQPLKEEGYATELFAQEAARLIAEHDTSRPLFLYLPFTAPHTPLQVPRGFSKTKFRNIDGEKRILYAAMVESLDTAVARIVEALKSRDMFSNTLLIFLSDNGGAWLGGASNDPLRSEKNTLYEGGLRVPALAVWPDRIPPGSVVTTPTHLVDLYPTLASLAGAQLGQDATLDGMDIWDSLLGKGDAQDRRILLQIEPERGALLDGKWKLIAKDFDQPSPRVELFDLEADPEEKTDLSSSHPQLTARLLALLTEYSSQAMPPRLKPKPADWQPPKVW